MICFVLCIWCNVKVWSTRRTDLFFELHALWIIILFLKRMLRNTFCCSLVMKATQGRNSNYLRCNFVSNEMIRFRIRTLKTRRMFKFVTLLYFNFFQSGQTCQVFYFVIVLEQTFPIYQTHQSVATCITKWRLYCVWLENQPNAFIFLNHL